MMLKWVGYLLLAAFMAYEAVVFENVLLSTLFVAVLLWPVLMMSILLFQRRGLDICMKVPVPVAEKNGHIQIQMEIRQKSFLPVMQMNADVICEPLFGGAQEIYPLIFGVDGRQNYQYIYDLSRNECGKVRLKVTRVCIWDFFIILV